MLKFLFISLILVSSLAHGQYNDNRSQDNSGNGTLTSRGLLNGASVFTVEFWVRTTENRGNDTYWQRPCLFGNETNGDNSGDFGIITNFGYIGMWEGISSKNRDQVFLSPYVRINDNQWHHIAAVNDGQTLSLYVDGNISGTLISGRPLFTNNAPLTFGAASLDHDWAGNSYDKTNFLSDGAFREARISNNIRYRANFTPEQYYSNDGFTSALYHFDGQDQHSNTYTSLDPNEPVSFDPQEAINDNYAQPATLYLNDSVALTGRLLLGKKDWSLSSDILIRFFEGNSRKVKYYHPEEIKGFQMGDNYFEPKFLSPSGAISTPIKKTMVKRLTPAGTAMSLYEYTNKSIEKNPSGGTTNKTTLVYFVGLPNSTDDKVYQFSDNKFAPHFDDRVSAIVKDRPALAEKIKSKNKDFFYSFISDASHQLKVWWNIINEYNKAP